MLCRKPLFLSFQRRSYETGTMQSSGYRVQMYNLFLFNQQKKEKIYYFAFINDKFINQKKFSYYDRSI